MDSGSGSPVPTSVSKSWRLKGQRRQGPAVGLQPGNQKWLMVGSRPQPSRSRITTNRRTGVAEVLVSAGNRAFRSRPEAYLREKYGMLGIPLSVDVTVQNRRENG
jgi:hypothetical protein